MSATTSDPSVTTTPIEEPTPLSPAAWRTIAGHFPEALYWMRLEEPFDTLAPCEWDVLGVILTSHCLGSSTPTQAELAFHTGFCVRSVRQSIAELRRNELLCAGDAPVKLDIGPRLTAYLRDFAFARDPRIWRWTSPVIAVVSDTPAPAPRAAERREPQAPLASANETPAPHAARITDDPAPYAGEHAEPQAPGPSATEAPAPRAGVTRRTGHDDSRSPRTLGAAIPTILQRIRVAETVPSAGGPQEAPHAGPSEDPPSLIKKNKDLSSSFSSEGGPTAATLAPGAHVDAATARRLALDALAAHFVRANPGIPLPRACDAGDVRLVEACTAGGTWDVEKLRQAHLDAIEGAFEKAPPDRAPTPRYIWGQYRFFLAHAAIGRAKRLRAGATPRPKKPRPPEDPPASSEWLAQHMRDACARLETIPAVSNSKLPLRFHDEAE